jgi:hypothetical protein
MYIAFLDEFGHIGPFVSRKDPRYNHSPIFGLAGFIIPHNRARSFATWFFQAKNQLLAAEVKTCGKHPATWEKKGTELFTTKNVARYPNIRSTIYRMMNQIYRNDGRLFFYGREKYQTATASNPSGLYTTVMGHAVRQIDKFCATQNQQFLMILDQHESRIQLLETAAKTMFGSQPARCLIEPPFQVESHLYQTIQAADWIATLVGRLWAFRVAPAQYADWDWSERLFGGRINGGVTHSTLWRSPVPQNLQLKLEAPAAKLAPGALGGA